MTWDLPRTGNGIRYDGYVTGPQGMRFVLFPEKHHGPAELKAAKVWLYENHDVVTIRVEREAVST